MNPLGLVTLLCLLTYLQSIALASIDPDPPTKDDPHIGQTVKIVSKPHPSTWIQPSYEKWKRLKRGLTKPEVKEFLGAAVGDIPDDPNAVVECGIVQDNSPDHYWSRRRGIGFFRNAYRSGFGFRTISYWNLAIHLMDGSRQMAFQQRLT